MLIKLPYVDYSVCLDACQKPGRSPRRGGRPDSLRGPFGVTPE